MQEQHIYLDLNVAEDDDNTIAQALLNLRGEHFEANGAARRSPADRGVPVIGEELAIARALHNLQHQLLEAAQAKIETYNP